MSARFEVVIAGGGPAGAAAAIVLARAGRSVVVLERSAYDQTRIGETLPPAAKKPLAQLGMWERFLMQEHAASPANLSAWGTEDLNETHFIFNRHGNGWRLDRRRFDEMLASSAVKYGAHIHTGARISTCRESACWELEYVQTGTVRHLKAEFMIDATGRASLLARKTGAKRVRFDRLVGIIGIFAAHEDDRDFRTLVEAGRDGWWYYALLPGARAIAAYMTDADFAPKGRARLVAHWRREFEKTVHIRPRLAGLELCEPLRLMPAATEVSNSLGSSNWLAIGDSALSFDPLSSQGIYRALQSGLLAGEHIQAFWKSRRTALAELSVWAQKTFNVYWEKRRTHYQRERRWPDSTFWRRRQNAILKHFENQNHSELGGTPL